MLRNVLPREEKEIAREILRQMLKEERDTAHLQLQEKPCTLIATVARRILGQNRPLHDDDQEYYALMEAIAERALSRIRDLAENELR